MKQYDSRRALPVRPALAAVLAVSAILVFGPSAAALAAQTPRPGDSLPAPHAQSPVAETADAVAGVGTQTPATDDSDAPASTPAKPAVSTARLFASESGLILSPVKTTKVMDFEMVVARIHEALAKSIHPARRQQAAGWKVYRATEPGPGGSVLFVFLMSPAVKGADYTVGKILMEAFPQEEALAIFDAYTSSFAGPQSLLSLRFLDDFSQPAKPRVPEPK
ncbi:MAG: hypothetical protein ABL971_02000 [Vicinamibacterales bacterium]